MKRYCIPDELFNNIPLPITGRELIGISGIGQEIRYKIPAATDTLIAREVWHCVCDFCYRLGAWIEEVAGEDSISSQPEILYIQPSSGKFLRIVGAFTNSGPTTNFTVLDTIDYHSDIQSVQVKFPTTGGNRIRFSVAPEFTNSDTSGTEESKFWNPVIPKYLNDKYSELIMHGSLMRIYVMSNKPWTDPALAKMHAVAYNNDLNKFSFGLITSGMRKHLLVDVEDWIINATTSSNSNNNQQ